MRYVIFRWSIFFICLIFLYSFCNTKVNAIAQANINSAVVVQLPTFTKEQLINNIENRAIYFLTRTKGVKFSIYKVKPGDNLWKIAKKYHYSVHTIIGCNPQLKTYNVYVNQKLLIPSSGGCLHPIQPNDTWQSIAEKYEIEESVLRKTNYSVSDDLSKVDYIFIPGRRPSIELLNKDMQEKYALRELFKSPLTGRLSSFFGTRRHPITGKVSKHGGIDIAVKNGTAVAAAASGVVIVASTNVGHYGTAVFIDHKNGYITHYGHLSKCLVKVGQKVRQGQIIARSGSTGRSTGPHLHFTIKRNGVNMDPLRFLW